MNREIRSAYEIAKFGGRHAGFYRQFSEATNNQIAKAIRSLESQIVIHEEKIADPARFLDPDLPDRQISALVNSYWPKEILNFQQQIEILNEVQRERSRGNGSTRRDRSELA